MCKRQQGTSLLKSFTYVHKLNQLKCQIHPKLMQPESFTINHLKGHSQCKLLHTGCDLNGDNTFLKHKVIVCLSFTLSLSKHWAQCFVGFAMLHQTWNKGGYQADRRESDDVNILYVTQKAANICFFLIGQSYWHLCGC